MLATHTFPLTLPYLAAHLLEDDCNANAGHQTTVNKLRWL